MVSNKQRLNNDRTKAILFGLRTRCSKAAISNTTVGDQTQIAQRAWSLTDFGCWPLYVYMHQQSTCEDLLLPSTCSTTFYACSAIYTNIWQLQSPCCSCFHNVQVILLQQHPVGSGSHPAQPPPQNTEHSSTHRDPYETNWSHYLSPWVLPLASHPVQNCKENTNQKRNFLRCDFLRIVNTN